MVFPRSPVFDVFAECSQLLKDKFCARHPYPLGPIPVVPHGPCAHWGLAQHAWPTRRRTSSGCYPRLQIIKLLAQGPIGPNKGTIGPNRGPIRDQKGAIGPKQFNNPRI